MNGGIAVVKQQIIFEIKRIADELNTKTVTRKDFKELSKISEKQVLKYFGSWSDAVIAAGLTAGTQRTKKSHDELFQNLYDFCTNINKIPTTIEFENSSGHATKTYRKNFGSWSNTLINFKVWLQTNHPDTKYIGMIDDENTNKEMIYKNDSVDSRIVWKGKKTTTFGAPLDYKGLRHEPINEQGVVFLFGKMNEELGIIVEAIKTGFPDCIGKRLVDKSKNLWEPISIEFEYHSKNFLEHGHDANQCDVIVCWVHDWHNCPLEVIELRSIIIPNSS